MPYIKTKLDAWYEHLSELSVTSQQHHAIVSVKFVIIFLLTPVSIDG